MLQGNITFKPMTRPDPAATVANNGLSVDGSGNIVLGNDTGGTDATLLSDRVIPLDDHDISFQGNDTSTNFIRGFRLDIVRNSDANQALQLDNENFPVINFLHTIAGFPAQILFSATSAGAANSYNIIDRSLSTGDLVFGAAINGNFTRLLVNDPNQNVSIVNQNANNRGFEVDFFGGNYRLGDIDNTGNGAKLEIDNNSLNGILRLSNATNDLSITINGDAGFTGTVAAPATITVNNGIVTNVA